MTFDANIKTVGFKDMHEDQVKAFMALIEVALSCADALEDEEVFFNAHQIAEDAVVLFGGNGIEIKCEVAY